MNTELSDPTDWRAQAACRGMGPDLFFPEKGQNGNEARKVCATCPVQEPCAELGSWQEAGIWGGYTVRAARHRPQPVITYPTHAEHLPATTVGDGYHTDLQRLFALLDEAGAA